LFRHKLSPWLQDEVRRLENGSVDEKQRHRNIPDAIAKVMANPANPILNKDLPENYKAVNVLGQYRLFFKILNAEQVVYFVWINNEDSIHAYENPDDCYRVFRGMVERGEIQPYVEPSIPKFILNPPDWSAPYVYAKLTRNIPAQQASANIHLSQVKENEFEIKAVSVTQKDQGLASKLVYEICKSADDHGIGLYHELNLQLDALSKSRKILSKNGFTLDQQIEDVEIWIRPGKRK
jgi:mRNA-degrading endonuclease RelE of RelBE toxin-antitoxin system